MPDSSSPAQDVPPTPEVGLTARLLAACGRDLLSVAPDAGAQRFVATLAMVARHFVADEAMLLEHRPGASQLELHTRWRRNPAQNHFVLPADGIDLPAPPELRKLIAHDGPLLLLPDRELAPVDGSWENFPLPEAAKAALAAPLRSPHGFAGLLILAAYDGARGWGTQALATLQQVAELFAVKLFQERASQPLSQQQQMLAAAFERLPEAAVVTTRGGRFIYATAACEPITGYKLTDIVQDESFSFDRYVDQRDRDRLLAELMRNGRVFNFKSRHYTANGEVRQTEVSSSVLPESVGGHIVSIVRDVTEIERKLVLLEEAQAVAHVGGWDFDPLTAEFKATDEIYRISDIEPGTPLNSVSVLARFTGKHRRVVARAARDAWRYGAPLDYEVDLQPVVPGTPPKRIRVRGHCEFRDGAVLRLYGTMQDITDIHHAEKFRRHYERRLRKLAAEISFAEERERKRIAADLHDDVVQDLGSLKLHMSQLALTTHGLQADLLQDALTILSRTINRTRKLMYEISPPLLYELGIAAALEWLLEQLADSARVETNLNIDNTLTRVRISSDIEILVFQSVRELLNNVRKHAHASVVSVRA
ncbi:MAG: PAS domain S-box protein [Gammaproteobacteria bacterium]|nr:PAS domain S-box protein [Gammaproteobacteria bacterium]